MVVCEKDLVVNENNYRQYWNKSCWLNFANFVAGIDTSKHPSSANSKNSTETKFFEKVENDVSRILRQEKMQEEYKKVNFLYKCNKCSICVRRSFWVICNVVFSLLICNVVFSLLICNVVFSLLIFNVVFALSVRPVPCPANNFKTTVGI